MLEDQVPGVCVLSLMIGKAAGVSGPRGVRTQLHDTVGKTAGGPGPMGIRT